jgi:hypothetical protein
LIAAEVHVLPPSTDTSTEATTPPPPSLAFPENVIVAPDEKEEPLEGEVIVAVGAVKSEDWEAEVRPACNVPVVLPCPANK